MSSLMHDGPPEIVGKRGTVVAAILGAPGARPGHLRRTAGGRKDCQCLLGLTTDAQRLPVK